MRSGVLNMRLHVEIFAIKKSFEKLIKTDINKLFNHFKWEGDRVSGQQHNINLHI